MCPNCELEMKLRINQRDMSPFWGCQQFPKCRGARPADPATTLTSGSSSSQRRPDLDHDTLQQMVEALSEQGLTQAQIEWEMVSVASDPQEAGSIRSQVQSINSNMVP